MKYRIELIMLDCDLRRKKLEIREISNPITAVSILDNLHKEARKRQSKSGMCHWAVMTVV